MTSTPSTPSTPSTHRSGAAHPDEASLVGYLRHETQHAHEALEQALDLLRPPLEQARFTAILARFYGFHQAWEKAIGLYPVIDAFRHDRSRLPMLQQDLAALGLSTGEQDQLPRCDSAGALASTEASAIGSIYVIEGSTLGGRLISRGLAGQPWVPRTGLTYFNPYADATGAMWQGFRTWCDAQGTRLDWPVAAAGAKATFAMLQAWLVPQSLR